METKNLSKIKMSIVDAITFHIHILTAKRLNVKYGCMVDAHRANFYKENCICFIGWLEGRPFGYALKKLRKESSYYSDIVSVFKHPHIHQRGVLDLIIEHAIHNGGHTLDCFESLEPMYEKYGFRTFAKIDWDECKKPSDWNNDLGKMSVCSMCLVTPYESDKYLQIRA